MSSEVAFRVAEDDEEFRERKLKPMEARAPRERMKMTEEMMKWRRSGLVSFGLMSFTLSCWKFGSIIPTC